MRVLLIEDNMPQSQLMMSALMAAGHSVTRIIDVTNRHPDKFAGLSPDRVEQQLDLHDFDVLLVDGVLAYDDEVRPGHNGWDIIASIRRRLDITCIGISSQEKTNERLVKAGAQFFLLKEEVPAKINALLAIIASKRSQEGSVQRVA